jgi:hypothetical protein
MKIMRYSKAQLCLLFILLNLILFTSGSEWHECGFQCKAGDVTVERLWLGDAQGNTLPPVVPGSQQKAYIWVTFENNANTDRYAVIILADIYVNGVLQKSLYNEEGLCVLDSIPPKATSSFPLYNFVYSYGQEVKIKKLVLSWETAKGTSCSNANRKCSNRNTKCFGGTDLEVDLTPPTCEIEGPNIACESIISPYKAAIQGQPTSHQQLMWRINGKDAEAESEDEGILVDWSIYGGGNHLLQLTVIWVDDSGRLIQSCNNDLKVLVVEVPSAEIERI